MAWITAADVADFATWFSASASTTPTTAQITTQIGFVEAEIQAALRAGGYSDAMTGAATSDLAYVKQAALYGVAAWIVEQKQTRGRPGTEGADDNRNTYAEHFRRMLEEIRTQPVLSDDVKLTGAPSITEGLKSEWTESTDDMPEPWVSEDGEW